MIYNTPWYGVCMYYDYYNWAFFFNFLVVPELLFIVDKKIKIK